MPTGATRQTPPNFNVSSKKVGRNTAVKMASELMVTEAHGGMAVCKKVRCAHPMADKVRQGAWD
jgi:hypothetical protein